MSIEYGVQTMPEFFEKRYGSRFLKFFSALAVFVFFVPYSAAVFMGLSYLFRSTFNIDYTASLVLMGGFTAVYMMMGGYRSMTMIDVFFGSIMVAGVLVLLGFVVQHGGGFHHISNGLSSIDPGLTRTVGPRRAPPRAPTAATRA